MKKVRITSLRPGDCFEQTMFLPTGQKLIPAGQRLNRRHIELLHRQSSADVVLADSLDELAEAGLITRVQYRMQVGEAAPSDVYGAGGALVLEQGELVEDHHLTALGAGAYGRRLQSRAEQARLRKERMQMADTLVEQLDEARPNLPLRIRPEEREIWDDHVPTGQPWPAPTELKQIRRELVEELQHLFGRVASGIQTDLQAFQTLVDRLFARLLDHRQRFTQLALLVSRKDDHLPDHAACVAVLAMATAAQLTWSAAQVKLAGLAGLLFDLGMLMVPRRIRVGCQQLSDEDRGRVRNHPVFSLSMLQSINDVPDIVKLVAYQHHERMDGSGYPRGEKGERIADLTRVIAVCDVFAAQTAPRTYRQRRLPYAAMEHMVRAASTGTFDRPAVRALVQAAGLFPVGSYVELSNQRLAHVIATNANHFDRPIVEMLGDANEPASRPINLAVVPSDRLFITRPAESPVGG